MITFHIGYSLWDLPKLLWLTSLSRCHPENPNQMPEAITIHLHSPILEGMTTGWRFEHFSTDLPQKRQCVHLSTLSCPHTEPSGHVPSRDQLARLSRISTHFKNNKIKGNGMHSSLLSFYYCFKAYKSVESINSCVYSRNFYSLLPEKGRVNLIYLISKMLSSEARVHYSHTANYCKVQ